MPSPPPLVSVFMPTYNYGDYIAKAIRSVLRQTHTDFELVVSDNASTDATEAIVREFAANDPRVRYFRNDTNQGLSANFNLAYRRTHPESRYWIGLPADDWWDPELLETLVGAARAYPGATIIYSDGYRVDDAGEVLNRYSDLLQHVPTAGLHHDLAALYRNNYIPFQAALVDRVAMDHVYSPDEVFDPEVPHTNDFHLWIQLMNRGASAYYVTEPLARIRKHERANTMPAKIIPRLQQEVRVFEKTRDSCPPNLRTVHADEHARRLKRLGFQLLQQKRLPEARKVLRDAQRVGTTFRLDLATARVISALPLPSTLRSKLWDLAAATAKAARRA